MSQRRPTKPVTTVDLPEPDEIVDVVESTTEPGGIPVASEAVPEPEPLVVETKVQPHDDPPQYRVKEGEPNGLILGPNDPIVLEGEDTGSEVIIKRDVFRKVYPRGTKRPSYILLYPAGMRVAKSTLQRVNT
jgi:hypothetical protein